MKFEQPTDAELRELARATWREFPRLPPIGEAEFRRAFQALAALPPEFQRPAMAAALLARGMMARFR